MASTDLEITVNTVAGEFLCKVHVPQSSTIRDMKYAIARDAKIPLLAQRILFGETEFEGMTMLSTLPIAGALDMTLVRLPEDEVRDLTMWLRNLELLDVIPNDFWFAGHEHLWTNWEIMHEAVTKEVGRPSGMPGDRGPCARFNALEYASEKLRDDRDIVLAAVRTYGEALQYASENLRGDREIVLAALRGSRSMYAHLRHVDGGVFRYASEALRADREMVLRAINDDKKAFEFVSADLRADRDIQIAAVQKSHYACGIEPEDWQVRAVQRGGPWGRIVLGLRYLRCRRFSGRSA